MASEEIITVIQPSSTSTLVNRKIDKKFEKIVQHPIAEPTLLTVANVLTLLRIFISPVFLLIYLEYETIGLSCWIVPYILLLLLAALELSDAFDGYLARKYDQVTDLGKVLDPMADSISRISILLTFTQPPVSLPLLIVFIFIYRDSIISTLRTVCALRGFALAARPSGKIKAILQAASTLSITALLVPHSMGLLSSYDLTWISSWIVVAAAGVALYSGAEYLYANFHFVRKALIRKKKWSLKRFKNIQQ